MNALREAFHDIDQVCDYYSVENIQRTIGVLLVDRLLTVMSSTSFTAKRLNTSTILIIEDDAYGEHPYIYVKIHPAVPVLIIGDTGCDKAGKNKKHGM